MGRSHSHSECTCKPALPCWPVKPISAHLAQEPRPADCQGKGQSSTTALLLRPIRALRARWTEPGAASRRGSGHDVGMFAPVQLSRFDLTRHIRTGERPKKKLNPLSCEAMRAAQHESMKRQLCPRTQSLLILPAQDRSDLRSAPLCSSKAGTTSCSCHANTRTNQCSVAAEA